MQRKLVCYVSDYPGSSSGQPLSTISACLCHRLTCWQQHLQPWLLAKGAETFLGGGVLPFHPANKEGRSYPYQFSELVSTAAFIFIQDKHSRFPVLLLTHSGIIAWALNCDLLDSHSAVEFSRGIQRDGSRQQYAFSPNRTSLSVKPWSQISCWIC